MKIRPEVVPFIIASAVLGAVVSTACVATGLGLVRSLCIGLPVMLVFTCYMLWFFRDPERVAPEDPAIVVAGAEGRVAKIVTLSHDEFMAMARFAGLNDESVKVFGDGPVVRISIFLSLFDVHVNRAPIAGQSTFLGYFPGKHLFTFTEKSSDVNQHNSILIANAQTCCLVNQIVGPVCRRVTYWLDKSRPVAVARGDRFGMMKFGSRLDMYLPEKDIEVTASEGLRVRAGATPVARLKGPQP